MRGKYEHKHKPSKGFVMSQLKDDNYWNNYFKSDIIKKEDFKFISWYRKDSHIYVRYIHNTCNKEHYCRLDKWNSNKIPCKYCSYLNRGKERKVNTEDKYETKTKQAFVNFVDDKFEYCSYSYQHKNLYLMLRCKECNNSIKIRYSDLLLGKSVRCGNCNPWASDAEVELLDYCKELGFNARKMLKGEINNYEYDIYIPELKIAFEYNGTYWHSSKFSRITSVYHKNKLEEALKKGVKVYNLWEYWGIDMCKSIISSKLGKDTRIYARNCIVKEIGALEAKEFVDNNHFEGYDKVKINLGLYYNNELVSCMTFKKNTTWELSRFCSKKYLTVVGGFNKLLSYYKKEYNYPFITWGYRDICPIYTDFVYYKIGLEYERYNPAILRYYNHKDNTVENRRKYQRKNQEKLFPDTFSWNDTERKNLEKQDIYAVWDTGCYKFSYTP